MSEALGESMPISVSFLSEYPDFLAFGLSFILSGKFLMSFIMLSKFFLETMIAYFIYFLSLFACILEVKWKITWVRFSELWSLYLSYLESHFEREKILMTEISYVHILIVHILIESMDRAESKVLS